MKFTRFAIAAAAVAAVSASAFAEEDAPVYPELSVTIAGTYNDGNTEDKSGTAAINYKDVIENVGEVTAGADGTITKTTLKSTTTDANGNTSTSKEEETTAKNGQVFGKILFPVADPFSVYVNSSLFADEIADVDYRAIVGAGVAVDLYKTETATFRLEAGVAPMWEKIADESEYYTMGRAAEIAEYYFAGGAKVWESFEYMPAFNDSDKYLFNAEVGIESPLNDLLSLQFVVKDRYNSLPGDDHEKNDVSATVGVRIKL
jgi:putative salt-induced outer membrane protein YdiY